MPVRLTGLFGRSKVRGPQSLCRGRRGPVYICAAIFGLCNAIVKGSIRVTRKNHAANCALLANWPL